MEDKFFQQLKKGVLELLVLEQICTRPTYGYELRSFLRERSGGLFDLKEGTLYPILYRLEDDRLIESHWTHTEDRTAPKKFYSATGAGREEQFRRRELWTQFQQTVSSFLKGADQS